ncbi:MAG: hemolysin family protein [Halobacteriales archaeon]|nr:hemolysin family protein [Halobacteriales archaeon]
MVEPFIAIAVVGVFLLVGVSAFFSSSETAIFTLEKHKLETLVGSGDRRAETLRRLKSNPHRLLVTVLVGNNVANIAAASLATAVLVSFLPPGEAVAVSTVFTSVFVLTFGEIAPKSYAVGHTESWSLRVSRPLAVAQTLLRPLVILFETINSVINRVTGGDPHIEKYVTREDIETLIAVGEREGAIDAHEGDILGRVFDLEDVTADSLAVGLDVTPYVETDASLDDVISVCAAENVSRLPVVEKGEVVGTVELRDALRVSEEGGALSDAVVEPLRVNGTMPIDDLLLKMRSNRVRLAVVEDTDGEVLGVVTIEEAVEEIVGEIRDKTE